MCPIPTCKRYSPTISNSPHIDQIVADIEVPSPPRNSSSTSINYYPPPPALNPPAYTETQSDISDPTAPVGSPLLDVCVDKVLHVVLNEITRFDQPISKTRSYQPTISSGLHLDLEATDDESDHYTTPSRQSNISQDLSQLGHPDLTLAHVSIPPTNLSESGPTSPLVRRSSKRRKNATTQGSEEVFNATAMNRTGSAQEGWPFLKDLGRVLECDVCAILLYEPVTTPCQHVSSISYIHLELKFSCFLLWKWRYHGMVLDSHFSAMSENGTDGGVDLHRCRLG